MTSPVAALIRAEIERRGPIPFADYMALALGAPGGYYATGAERPTRAGDFLTAPELHPIFGATLSRQLAEAWERLDRPPTFTLLEYGGGSGALAVAIMGGLRADGSGLADALRYCPTELNERRTAALTERVRAAGVPVVDASDADREPVTGVVLANEFLDALPVHVVEVRGGRLLEAHVAATPDGSFEEVLLAPSSPALDRRVAALAGLGVILDEGQRAEICLALDAWAEEVGRRLARGLVLAVDYGAPAAELYGPPRRAGTLMTYRGHTADAGPDAPYRDVGERDITAHVDMTTVENLLDERGFDIVGETTQARFLVGCGLEEVLRREQATLADLQEGLLLRSAVARLLDPRHLGAFRVLLAGRGLPPGPPLRGLAAG